jgi:hypothetical protein
MIGCLENQNELSGEENKEDRRRTQGRVHSFIFRKMTSYTATDITYAFPAGWAIGDTWRPNAPTGSDNAV